MSAFKIRYSMCMGTERIWVEHQGAAGGANLRRVSVENNLIDGASYACMTSFLRLHANDTKAADGVTYLDEGELRIIWKDYSLANYCASLMGRYQGECAALPGDTAILNTATGEALRYEPATQQELQDRE